VNRILIIAAILLIALPAFAQIDAVATIGVQEGYKVPYFEAALEARHSFDRFAIFGEARGASGRKSDTGDGWHVATRAAASVRVWREFSLGGGYAWSKQWTSLYQKQAGRPVLYAGWQRDADQVDGFWIFRGNDHRNGIHGLDLRYTHFLNRRLGLRARVEFYGGYQTDRPKEPIFAGGPSGGIVWRW
jgi:hypothetical protein